MSNFFFSIIVVSLNTKSKFIKTFLSICNQNFQSKEIIVVDGLSKDGTLYFIYKNKKKINKLIIEKDKGIYDAMNKGVKIASGKYIIFLNSGDIFFNKQTLSDVKKKILLPTDILYGNTIVKNLINYPVISKKVSNNDYKIPFCHQSCAIRTSLHKKYLYNINYSIAADFDFFYKLKNINSKFQKINKFISVIEAGGISDKNRFKCLLENQRIVYKNNKQFLAKFLSLFEILLYILKNLIKIILGKKNTNKIIKLKKKFI